MGHKKCYSTIDMPTRLQLPSSYELKFVMPCLGLPCQLCLLCNSKAAIQCRPWPTLGAAITVYCQPWRPLEGRVGGVLLLELVAYSGLVSGTVVSVIICLPCPEYFNHLWGRLILATDTIGVGHCL